MSPALGDVTDAATVLMEGHVQLTEDVSLQAVNQVGQESHVHKVRRI